MQRLSDDGSAVTQPMHGFDAEGEVRNLIESGTGEFDDVALRERCQPTVVDVNKVRRRLRQLVSVESGVKALDARPNGRVGGGFAGEVSGIEFGEGGVDVVEGETEDRLN